MNLLRAGYAGVNINPPLGIGIAGYYVPRFAKGFLDDLTASALVLACGDTRIALVTVDMEGWTTPLANECAEVIEKATGIPKNNVFLSCTHTHTGPYFYVPDQCTEAGAQQILTYVEFLKQRLADVVTLAQNDLRDARMGYIVGQAPDRIAYIRRYRMKDGTVMTCPPVGDPNIDHPLGTLDQRVNVLRFDREGGQTVVLVNYGLHADTTNGEMISADFPHWLRLTVEKALDGVQCMFFNGAEGDVGSTHVHPEGGDMNDTEISFDNEMKSPGMARFVGRALAGTVLQVYDKVCYTDVESIDIRRRSFVVAANVPDPKDLPLAHRYKEYHERGRDDLIPYAAMELTTVLAEALRMCKYENGPYEFPIEITGLRIGNVAMVGIPGEPFTEVGVKIKEAPGWDAILPCALTNGGEGYFPVGSAYDEGGYETRTSRYKAGVAETVIENARQLLEELK